MLSEENNLQDLYITPASVGLWILTFLIVGRPVSILIIVGALNAFILPLALGIILFASRKAAIVNQYRHPWWMTIAGWVVVVALGLMCIYAITSDLGRLWNS